jgi:hypothetical protein
MFDKAEAEFRELSEKKRIVENDKHKITKVRRSIACVDWHIQDWSVAAMPLL